MNPVISYLQANVALLKKANGARPRLNGYHNVDDFVLRNGESFDHETTRPLLLMPLGLCFQNASLRAKRDASLTYCEGYAWNVIPVLHAWLVDGDGQLIETTWREVGSAYYGIRFRTDYVWEQIKKHGHYSVLDQWQEHWPTIHAPRESWAKEAA
jgi:hypothetical protein